MDLTGVLRGALRKHFVRSSTRTLRIGCRACVRHRGRSRRDIARGRGGGCRCWRRAVRTGEGRRRGLGLASVERRLRRFAFADVFLRRAVWRWDCCSFCLLHPSRRRGALVNVDAITSISPLPGGTYLIALANGQEVRASRIQSRVLLDQFLKL